MRLGMFVTATFHAPQKVLRAVVPSAAVLHLHDRDWVYEPAGDKSFRRFRSSGRQYAPLSGMAEIISGIKPGDRQWCRTRSGFFQNTSEQARPPVYGTVKARWLEAAESFRQPTDALHQFRRLAHFEIKADQRQVHRESIERARPRMQYACALIERFRSSPPPVCTRSAAISAEARNTIRA